MEFFEQLLSETPKKISYGPRKLSLPNIGNLILYGPPKCGKTSLALLHASQKKEPYLYIDLQDYRVGEIEYGALYEFAKSKKISTLILDNASGSELVSQSDSVQTILLSRENIALDGMEPYRLFGVDFEEYISLQESTTQSRNEEEMIAHIFADFLKDGSLPAISELSEFDKQRYKKSCVKDATSSKTEEMILVEFLRRCAMKFSLLQIFEAIKAKNKISKDIFYAYAQKLTESGTLFFVEKLHQKNSPKKIYSYDFSLKTAVNSKKDFAGVFENMVFLELKSRGYEIYYTDEAGLFVPELEKTVIAKPFLSDTENELFAKLSKKASELGVKEVEIITVSREDEKEFSNIKISSIPFWQWALSF